MLIQHFNMSQEGKVAFITGGLGGIGLALGESLLKHGAKVALVDIRDGKEIEELKQKYGEEKVTALKCDITDNGQLRATYQKVINTFGGLDIVINCAGMIDEVNFERAFAVNLTAFIASSYMAVEGMRKDRGGRGGILINISSVGGLGAYPYVVTYCSTKAAIIHFSKGLMANLDEASGVKVGTICPELVDTELSNINPNPEWRENDVTQPYAKENMTTYRSVVKSFIPMRPERVGETLIKYLVEPDLHGSTILISNDKVEYNYPEEIKGKEIEVESK